MATSPLSFPDMRYLEALIHRLIPVSILGFHSNWVEHNPWEDQLKDDIDIATNTKTNTFSNVRYLNQDDTCNITYLSQAEDDQ